MMSDGAGRAIGHGSFRHANRPPEAGPMPAATAGKHLRLCPPRPRLPQVAGGRAARRQSRSQRVAISHREQADAGAGASRQG